MSTLIEHIETNQVEQPDRLAFWNRIASETFNGLVVDSERETFNAEIWRWSFGDLMLTRPRSPAAIVRRNAKRARAGENRVILHMQHAGTCLHTQCGEAHQLHAGDFVLADSNADYSIELNGPNDMLVLEMRRDELAAHIPHLDDIISKRIPGEAPSSRLLHDFVLSLWRQGDQSMADPQWPEGVSSVLYNLLSMAVSGSSFNVAAEGKLLRKMMALIEARLCDPELRTSTLADELGVSIRTVQNAFAATGQTPSAYILNRRLQQATERLVAAPHISITEIAYESGFNDCSYFTRCFKHRHGVSPTAYRSTH